jgi:hypothetical protein
VCMVMVSMVNKYKIVNEINCCSLNICVYFKRKIDL